MKAALHLFFAILAGGVAFGAGLTSVEFDGNSYSNIDKVYISSGGRIIILFPGGGTSASADKLPADFLSSWLGSSALATAKSGETAAAQAALDRAVRTGMFREVAGVVYDIRKPASGFVGFRNLKVMQVTDDGDIIDTAPDDVYSTTVIFVKHLPPLGDTDFISFSCLPDGTFSYINKNGDDRTVRKYDCGKICERDEIPAKVLSGELAYADSSTAGAAVKDVVATLPDSANLVASGSGFFVSADGYLVTNNHVVKGARRLVVKIADATYPATVVRVDETNDLALVKVKGTFAPLRVATNAVQLGDQVFTIGFPDVVLQGTQPKYTSGTISSLAGLRDDPTEYQISVPVQPGNSGGPLADMTGEVKGVIVARLDDFAALRSTGGFAQNVNYAVKGNLLRDFLAAGGEVDLSQPAASAASDNAVATVQKSVAIVLIY